MKLIDIGINLMDSAYNRDRDGVVEAAAKAGVTPLVITGTSVQGSLDAALYASAYNALNPGALYTTAGVHPHRAADCGDGTMDLLRGLVREKGARAIGECGLDYDRDFSPRDTQHRWFIKQAELAAELALPLFLHERAAFFGVLPVIREFSGNVPAVLVHCFTGTGEELDQYLSLGCYIGITGWICDDRRGKHLRGLVKNIPRDRLLLETDGPFLLPRDLPFKVRNRRNEPKYLPHIAETVARCLGEDPETLAEESRANSKRFFGI